MIYINESEIIDRLKDGDITALEIVYKEYADRLYSFSLSICKSKETAEDIIANIFCILYTYITSGKHIKNLKAFLYTSVRNATYDEINFLSRNDPLPEDDIYKSNALDVSDNVLINLSLERLPSDEREIVLLHCYEGFLHREIAKMLDIPEGTVRWKYRNAISKLKTWIEGVDDD